jgi:uncharacterized protein YrzB (UPF0473 family)
LVRFIKKESKTEVITLSEEKEIFQLEDEDGKLVDCELLEILDVEGSQYYILLPLEDNEEEEAIILKLAKDEEGNDTLITIEDDEEWEKVADAYEELLAEDEE